MNFDLICFANSIAYHLLGSHGYRSSTSYPCYAPKQLALLDCHLPENGIIGGIDPEPNLTNLQFGLVQSDLWLLISDSWVGKSGTKPNGFLVSLRGNGLQIGYLQTGLTKHDKFVRSVGVTYVSKTRMLMIISWARLLSMILTCSVWNKISMSACKWLS